jgi:hypothetical protein
VWLYKDINLRVERGERLGIIEKTSRETTAQDFITAPTTGNIKFVAVLLLCSKWEPDLPAK